VTRIEHFQCDRCGARQDGKPRLTLMLPQIEIADTMGTTTRGTTTRTSEDLCDECATGLRAWMNEASEPMPAPKPRTARKK
jgi:hypothetical protein